MEVRALFGRFVWRGVTSMTSQSDLPEVRGSIPHWSKTQQPWSRTQQPFRTQQTVRWCRRSNGERRNWLFPLGCTTVQCCLMPSRSPGSHRPWMLCYNPSWCAGNWSRHRTGWGVGTSGSSLEWVASVEVCRRWRSCFLRRLHTTTQYLIVLESDWPVTIPTARGQTWQDRDSSSGLTQLVRSWNH